MLYVEDTLLLAEQGKDSLFTFNPEVVSDAIKALHEKGEFSPKMLGEEEGSALILENYRILSQAIDKGVQEAKDDDLKHEIPVELEAALKDNAFVFSGFKAYHTLNEAGLTLQSKDGGIKSFEVFSREAGDVFKKQRLNLQAEYRHAVQTAQMAARWNDIEVDGDRYDLQYRTVGDGKVRKEHAELNNTTLPPSDPFWQSFYPPNGWGCRCTATQVRKGKYPSSDSAEAISKGENYTSKPGEKIFRFNAGLKKKVFPDKHPNFPKGCGDCDKKLKLSYDKNNPDCQACLEIAKCLNKFGTKERLKERRKELKKEAAKFKNKPFKNKDFEKDIFISGAGIDEYLNQPHEHYNEKNELIKSIDKIVKEAKYLGVNPTYKKNEIRNSHIFETEVGKNKSWLIIREYHDGRALLHSCSDNLKIARETKK